MANAIVGSARQLRVVHVLRAPLGGLYRHVLDLAHEQIRRGHVVGIVADSLTGGAQADRTLGDLEPHLGLGLLRLPMHRDPHPSDLPLVWRLTRHIHRLKPDVVHGHGSKGGVYSRLSGFVPGASDPVRVYTPHGGSLNFRPGSKTSWAFMRAEGLMARRTDLLLFESSFVAARYRQLVGGTTRLRRIVHNGIADSEFVPVVRRPDAADIVYVGELRAAKGIDTLLDALPLVGRRLGRPASALLVGTGPDREALIDHARRLGLAEQVTFGGAMPARQAFERGKILVVPSRAESLPYIVLEAAGARIPIVTTKVGGIPEIFGPFSDRLLQPDDVEQLAARVADMLASPDADLAADAASLAAYVHRGFSIGGMVDAVLSSYRDALLDKARPRSSATPTIPASSQQPEA